MRKATSTNTQNRAILGRSCVLHDTLASISLRWKVAVLDAVARGATSFGALRRALPAVTDQMLGTRLRELISEGLVLKGVDEHSAPRYAITTSGRELLAILEDLCRWAKRRTTLPA